MKNNKNINWNKFRDETAAKCLASLLSNPQEISRTKENCRFSRMTIQEKMADRACSYANALTQYLINHPFQITENFHE